MERTGSAKSTRSKRAEARETSPRAVRDPERTRARILEAAKAEFAQHGLGGARVDRIAQAADANKRMLYYYFGNKDDLFLAVLESAYAHIRDAEKALRLTEIEPTEAVRRLVAFTWDYYLLHPEFMTLLNSANLHRARHLEKSSTVRRMHNPFVAMIADILTRGHAAGSFRGDVDPVQLYISIAGLTYFYLGNKYTLSAIFGRDLLSPRARAQRLAHMTDVVLGYLTARA
jgi:AcrR family transcriptional regulator